MKILYVITQAEMGGAQNYVATLARATKSQNWTVDVAIGELGDNWLGQEIEALGGKIWPLKRLRRAISPINDVLAIFELAKLYQKIKPDIIHLNSSKAGVLGSLAIGVYRITGSKCKLIYTAHGWIFNEPMPWLKKQLFYWLERITSGYKDKIICVSEYDRQVGIKTKVAKEQKLITVNIGVNLPDDFFLTRIEALQQLISNSNSSEGNIIIGTIANFYATKGLPYLIEAIDILINTYNLSLNLIIIGDGELRVQLENKIKELKLQNNITLLGRLPQGSRYLKAFDIFVLASVKEGFPYCLLEAMSASLPIASTDVGGIPEIIATGKTGLLCRAKDSQSLADNIKILTEDKQLRLSMGEAGKVRVRDYFSQKKMVEHTLEIYQL